MSISNYAVILMFLALLLFSIILVAIAAIFYILYKHNRSTTSNIPPSYSTVTTEPAQEASDISIHQGTVQAAPSVIPDKVEAETEKTDIILPDNKPNVEILSEQETIEQIKFDDDDEIEDENILVVIAAAVAYLGMNNGKKYSIRSIRRVKRSPLVRSAWANSGIMQNTRPF